jgi:hypothetical protein
MKLPRHLLLCYMVISVSLWLLGCDAWTRAQGTVRDEAGKPIADATVTLKIESDSRTFHSDNDGHYLIQLAQPPVKVNATLTVVKAGFLPYEKRLKGPAVYRELDVVLKAEPVTSQIITRAMFPSASDKAQNVDCFRGFSDSTSVNAVVQKCGRPDEELGSGVYIFVWHLADGSTVSVNTPYLSRIDYLRYTDASGKSVSLLRKEK